MGISGLPELEARVLLAQLFGQELSILLFQTPEHLGNQLHISELPSATTLRKGVARHRFGIGSENFTRCDIAKIEIPVPGR